MNKKYLWISLSILVLILFFSMTKGITGNAIFRLPSVATSCNGDAVCETNSLNVEEVIQLSKNSIGNALISLGGQNNNYVTIESDDGLEVDSSSYIYLSANEYIDLRTTANDGRIDLNSNYRVFLSSGNAEVNVESGHINLRAPNPPGEITLEAGDVIILQTGNGIALIGSSGNFDAIVPEEDIEFYADIGGFVFYASDDPDGPLDGGVDFEIDANGTIDLSDLYNGDNSGYLCVNSQGGIFRSEIGC